MKKSIGNTTFVLCLFLSLTITVGCTTSKKSSEESEVQNSSAPFGITPEDAENRLGKLPRFLRESDLFSTNIVDPTKLFDNVYFVGYNGVGSFVVNTSDGIILIDTMWNPNDAENVIIPGIEKLGLDPESIKYVIITHGHSDHFGSARYFEDKYGAEIFISKSDWEDMNDPEALVLMDPFGNYSNELPIPTAISELTDGQKLTLGDTTLTILSTPGHTPGGISLLIPVKDNGVPHMAAIWGGTGLPATLEENETYLKSLNYFESMANAAGVDAEMAHHPFVNNLLEKMAIRRNSEPGDQNPLIIGNDEFRNYMDTSLRKNVVDKIASLK